MLTPRDEAMLRALTVRELKQELLVLEMELAVSYLPKRKAWLEVRIDNLREIINDKLQE